MSHGFFNNCCQFATRPPTACSPVETLCIGNVFRKLTNLQHSDQIIAIVAGKRSPSQPNIRHNRHSRRIHSSIPSLPLPCLKGIIGPARHL
jgi:hypothetical protein